MTIFDYATGVKFTKSGAEVKKRYRGELQSLKRG